MHGLYSQGKHKQQESYPHPIDDMNAEVYYNSKNNIQKYELIYWC